MARTTDLLPTVPQLTTLVSMRADKDALSTAYRKVYGHLHRRVTRGQFICAYNNLKTNQVVYSLDRVMNNEDAVRQQPFAGKKTVPPKLRKDVWVPLWAATFPSAQHGLEVFRKLREYKILHEHSWDASDLPELEDLERNDKGKPRDPSKDYRPRIGGPRKRMSDMKKRKSKMIMNQKENSIADLAAILLQYPDVASEELSRETVKALGAVQHEVEDLRDKYGQGRHKTIFNQLASLKKRNQEGSEKGADGQSVRGLNIAIAKNKVKCEKLAAIQKAMEERISRTKTQLAEATTLHDVEDIAESVGMTRIKSRHTDEEDAKAERALLSDSAQQPSAPQEGNQHEKKPEETPSERQSRLEELQDRKKAVEEVLSRGFRDIGNSSYPSSEMVAADLLNDYAFNPKLAELKRTRRQYGLLGNFRDPNLQSLLEEAELKEGSPLGNFSTAGIVTYWRDKFDAEAASQWPDNVRHDSLHLAKHTLPKLKTEPPQLMENRYAYDERGNRIPEEEAQRMEARLERLRLEAEEQTKLVAREEAQKRESLWGTIKSRLGLPTAANRPQTTA